MKIAPVDIPVTAVGSLAWKYVQTLAGQVLGNVLRNGPSWRTAWRRAPEGRTHLQPLPGLGAYSEIATDGQRYYADPFVIFRDGMHHVFVEELPYATQKGIISHLSIDADGKASRVAPVLERAPHLSYPQIIEHEGEVYMLPEASASGALDLYKAERFPDRLDDFLDRCHQAGQTRPTPLMLRYGAGDYNCLHQDLYGEEAFPLQAVIVLSRLGEDYTGSEFLLVENLPRAQSRGTAITLQQGQALLWPTRYRPGSGSRGSYRIAVRHGVSEIRSGRRLTLGIIFHDAA